MSISYDYEGRPFMAVDPGKTPVRLTPLYRGRPDATGKMLKTHFPNDCVGLRAEDGGLVVRQGEGRYVRLADGAALVSDDPAAV